MTYTIALVACSAAKLDHDAPAKDLYTSQLFKKARAYAEAIADEWFILSAEHGLYHPEDYLAPYDTKLTAGTSKAWGKRTQAQLISILGQRDRGEVELVVLAGKHYRTAVEGLNNVSVPMQGLGIGQQLAYLTKQLDDLEFKRWEKGRAELPPAVTDEMLHALDRDAVASMLWFVRGWMKGPRPNFDEALRYAYRDQLDAQARLEARKQQLLDEAAEGIARATGSRGSTYTVIQPDGSSDSGSWGQL